nr:hypothetical protein [uncultured Prevotella sp.]
MDDKHQTVLGPTKKIPSRTVFSPFSNASLSFMGLHAPTPSVFTGMDLPY